MATRSTNGPAGNSGSTGSLRLLVVANEAVGGGRLMEEISKRAGDLDNAEVMIVSPARGASPLALAAGDVDDEIAQAHKRLESSVGALRQMGIIARGEVGEAQPELAMRDALVKFPADEVIIVAPPPEETTWLEKDLLERVRSEVDVPITYVEVEADKQAPAVTDVQEVSPRKRQRAAQRRHEEAETDYLPPMPARDRTALVLGPLGTLALWLLTSTCQNELFHDFSGTDTGCVVLGLLSIFALIITATHVPALLLLRSGRRTSEGLTRFLADTILFYMPPALLAGLIIAVVA